MHTTALETVHPSANDASPAAVLFRALVSVKEGVSSSVNIAFFAWLKLHIENLSWKQVIDNNWKLEFSFHPFNLQVLDPMEIFTDILTINPNIIKVEPDISNPKLDYATLEAIHAFRPPFQRQSMCLSAAALRYEDLPYVALTALKILHTVNSGYLRQYVV